MWAKNNYSLPRESVKAETPVNPSGDPEVREYTFTAAETAVQSNPQPVVTNRLPESNFTPQPPVSPNLPPLTPPNSQNSNAIVPPPPPRNLGNQRSLSDVITFNRAAANPSSGNNILTGLAGNDSLDGKAGADTMIGGLGNDTYSVRFPLRLAMSRLPSYLSLRACWFWVSTQNNGCAPP